MKNRNTIDAKTCFTLTIVIYPKLTGKKKKKELQSLGYIFQIKCCFFKVIYVSKFENRIIFIDFVLVKITITPSKRKVYC